MRFIKMSHLAKIKIVILVLCFVCIFNRHGEVQSMLLP